MFCKNCGNELKDTDRFCTVCGTPVEPQLTEDMGQGRVFGKGKKKAIVIAAFCVVLLLAAGTAGVFYFTSDGYISGKNLKLAQKCYEAEEYSDALSYCNDALELEPALTDAYLLQADILLAERKYEEAVQNLEKGLKRTREDETAQGLLAEKIDEVNRAEAAAVTTGFQEYLDQKLAPQYGYAQLNSQVKEFDPSTWSTYGPGEEELHWTDTDGIVFARICDWDGDGRDELLAMIQEEGSRSLCVYEMEDERVVKKSECLAERRDDLAESDEVWILLDVEGGKGLYSSLTYRSVISESNRETAGLYQYDGETLYVPLTFEYRWDPDSSECCASQYDRNGKLLSSEKVYNFLHDGSEYELILDREYCEGRVTELFAEYGIAWDSDEDLPAADNGSEELARLCMWLDYRDRYSDGTTYVYHFNDWDSPLLVYERFLRGEETLQVRGDMGDTWLGGGREEWTFQDILESIEHSYLEYSAQEVSAAKYAFMDCGGDGVEEMLLRFIWYGPNLFESWDDGARNVVISCKSGKLELVYMDETWEGYARDIDYYGCINSSFSPHRGLTESAQQYIDGNGDLQTVYSGEELWGREISYLVPAAYEEAFAEINEYEPYIGIMHYWIKDEEYFVLCGGGDTEECQRFIALCEQEGKQFVAEDDMESLLANLVGQRLKELGIKETWGTGNGLHWNSWQIEAAGKETDQEVVKADRMLAKEIRYWNGSAEEYNYVYIYDDSGRVTKRILYSSDGITNFTVDYFYDEQGNLMEEFGANGEEYASSYSYSYNSQGKLVNEWRRYYGDIEYIYDSQGKLVKEIHCASSLVYLEEAGATHWYDYYYDEQGNLTEKIQHISDAADGIIAQEEYTFDGQGNLTEMTVHRENDGSSQDYRYIYSYDAQGNQIKEVCYTDDGSAINWRSEYIYDEWGNQIKEIHYNGDGSETNRIEYIYE